MDKDYVLYQYDEENTPDFIMNTAAEALDLLAQYNSDFSRDIDKDEVASALRIIAHYLHTEADKFIVAE